MVRAPTKRRKHVVLAWVVNAYLIAFGGLLLLSGRFGDMFLEPREQAKAIGAYVFIASALSPTGTTWRS